MIAVALVILGAGAARAQGPRASRAELDRAVLLFEESERLYNEGQFAEAAALLRRAYALHADPTLLFNLARALEGLGDLDGAIEAYEQYLRDAESPPDRGAIERVIATLRAQREQLRGPRERPDPEVDAQPEPPPPPPRSEPEIAPWILAGAGAAVLGVGIGLGVASTSDASAAAAEPVQVVAIDLHARAEALAIAADVLFVAGGLAAGIGLVWGIVSVTSGGDAEPAQATVDVSIVPGGLALSGTF
jgi:tetratricopeptide (TPR) repeat protein